jgi:hypothetical protein
MNSSLESAILCALYDRFESRPGSPKMTLGDLYEAIGVSASDSREVGQVRHQLFSLERKGWVTSRILEDGSGGVVAITPEAVKVVQDRWQVCPKVASDGAVETAAGALPPSHSVQPGHAQSAINWSWPFLVSGLNFLAGVLGNLLAAWIQQDVLGNVFTFPRIAAISFLTMVVLVTGVLMQRQPSLSPKRRIVIIGALVAVTTLIAIILPILAGPGGSTFNYAIQVQAQGTGEDIPNAEIRMDIGDGRAPLRGITDVDGFARISVDARFEKQRAILTVEAPGYKKHRQEIDLTNSGVPHFVQLEPIH